ncbi:hypothetical protein CEXT_774951 [Caerostris extrusa]|uniref:Uncharacterized protein n=1 Tax=Caerostris extrusa TaxID=172846 RepID=A0AAV4SHD6_CAEEX|nr:hypothetical protein CEXT_774951 [Caerostris extrusa]
MEDGSNEAFFGFLVARAFSVRMGGFDSAGGNLWFGSQMDVSQVRKAVTVFCNKAKEEETLITLKTGDTHKTNAFPAAKLDITESETSHVKTSLSAPLSVYDHLTTSVLPPKPFLHENRRVASLVSAPKNPLLSNQRGARLRVVALVHPVDDRAGCGLLSSVDMRRWWSFDGYVGDPRVI